MYRWVSCLLMLSMIRLQFVCCCGTFVHFPNVLEIAQGTSTGNCNSTLHCCEHKSHNHSSSDHDHDQSSNTFQEIDSGDHALVSAAIPAYESDLDHLHTANRAEEFGEADFVNQHGLVAYEQESCDHHLHLMPLQVSAVSKTNLQSLVLVSSLLPSDVKEYTVGYLFHVHMESRSTGNEVDILTGLGRLRI